MREHFARRPNLTLTLVATVVGLALAWQLKGPAASPPVGYTPGDPRDRSVRTIEQLETEQAALKAEIARLRADLADYRARAAAETDRLQRLNVALDAQRAAAGLTVMRGPGVVVTLDDSSARNLPASSDPNAFLVHDYDLRDVINVLWLAGAEAIAVNDERDVSNTSVYCVGSTVMVNTTRLSPPYVVRAIGEPASLAETLHNPSYLTTLRQKVERYGIKFQVAQSPKMTLSAYTGGFSVKHCQTITRE
jgi:uncharacterized protein YlxW (UPF0749 family)